MRGSQTGGRHGPDRLGEARTAGARALLAHVGGRDRRARRVARHHHQGGSADPARGIRDWSRRGDRDDERRRRQPYPDPLRSRVRETLRRLPNSRVIRRHQPASALPRRPPPSRRGALSDRHRPHALAPANDRIWPPTYRRGPVEERCNPLPEALRRPRDLPTRSSTTTGPARPWRTSLDPVAPLAPWFSFSRPRRQEPPLRAPAISSHPATPGVGSPAGPKRSGGAALCAA